eukprot:SAG31_NODE_2221_length_6156_cov_5.333994_10_plen_310_part_00
MLQQACQHACPGCGRPEVSKRTADAHARTCPYVQLRETWHNPALDSGEWEVEAILAVRGPPSHRFYKLKWAGGLTDKQSLGERDRGGWTDNWQPAMNVHCSELVEEFYELHPATRHVHVEGHTLGGEIIPRCPHCNKMGFSSTQKFVRHLRHCPFQPRQRRRDSVIGRNICATRRDQYQKSLPRTTVRDREGREHQFKNARCGNYLGHTNAADSTTDEDMHRRMQLASVGYWKARHLFCSPLLKKKHKLRMFRRYLMKLTYAGADTWRLTKTAQKALNHWTAQKVCHITGATLKDESKARSVHTVNMLR